MVQMVLIADYINKNSGNQQKIGEVSNPKGLIISSLGGGRNDGVDVLRLVLCWFIILLHTSTIHKFVAPLCFIAVPVFFFISGYYLSKGDYENNLRKAISKIFKIIIVANVIYGILYVTPVRLLLRSGEYKGFFVDVILLNNNPFCGHLWYLNAYLYALLILFGLRKIQLKLDKYIIPIVFGVVLIVISMGKYSELLFSADINILITRNFLGTAIPCLLCGRYISMHERVLSFFKDRRMSMGSVALFLLFSYSEFLFFKFNKELSGGDLYLFTIPLGLSLFVWTLNYTPQYTFPFIKRFFDNLKYCGRKYSLDIYIIHYPVLQLCLIYIERTSGSHVPIVYYFFLSLLVMIVSLIVSHFFEKYIKIKLISICLKSKQ